MTVAVKASLTVLAAAGFLGASSAYACCRNYAEFADQCRSQGGIPSKNPLRCNPAPVPGGGISAPGNDGGAARRAQEEAAAAAEQQRQEADRIERERQAAEEQSRKEDAERQAKFLRDRDAAAGTLRGSIGTSAGPNSSGGPQLRGSTEVAVGRQLRGAVAQPDLGGREAAWKQLHCAASILGPAIAALDLDSKSRKPDFNEFRFLADEAANALNGQKLRVSCAPAPAMPKYSGPAKEPARQALAEQRLVAKVLDLGTKLEDARRKQDEAQAKLRGDAAPKVDPAADVIEQQRRINRARDAAGNEMAKAQRDFNEGKRSEESARKELKKIEQKVDSVVRGERLSWDEEPPVAVKEGKK